MCKFLQAYHLRFPEFLHSRSTSLPGKIHDSPSWFPNRGTPYPRELIFPPNTRSHKLYPSIDSNIRFPVSVALHFSSTPVISIFFLSLYTFPKHVAVLSSVDSTLAIFLIALHFALQAAVLSSVDSTLAIFLIALHFTLHAAVLSSVDSTLAIFFNRSTFYPACCSAIFSG